MIQTTRIAALLLLGASIQTAYAQEVAPPSPSEIVSVKSPQTSFKPNATIDITVTVTDRSGNPLARTLKVTVYDQASAAGAGLGEAVLQGDVQTSAQSGSAQFRLPIEKESRYLVRAVGRDASGGPIAGSQAILVGQPNQPSGGIFDDRIDELLRDWSVHAEKINTLYADFTRTVVDVVWRTKEVHKGRAYYRAPKQARLDIIDIENGKPVESYIVTGKGEIWEFKKQLKQVNVFELPPEMVKEQQLKDGPLPFLFGTDPEKAKARYHFKIKSDDGRIVDLIIIPKLHDDAQNFARAEIRLDVETFMPKKLTLTEPNSNQITFDFNGIYTNIEIDPEVYFKCDRSKVPANWRFVRRKVAERGDRPSNLR